MSERTTLHFGIDHDGPNDQVQGFNNIKQLAPSTKFHLSLPNFVGLCKTRRNKQTKMPTLSNFYTMQDASQHKTKDDCWIVIDGKVYDVTQYLDDHPGGDDVILAATGKDATDDFEDAGHSKSARELMEQYFIGELDTSSPIPAKKNYSEKFMQLTNQYWVVPVAVVGISVVVGFLYLRKK